ncbi:RES family NAD+ phosphorylase [Vibrio sp. RC27]
MELYRLSVADFADLEGVGGLYTAGRWHDRGMLACYTVFSRSLAALERLVHESMDEMPKLVMLTIWVPDDIKIQRLITEELPKGWDSLPDSGIARVVSQSFYDERESLLLQVPSAVIHDEFNCIINPRHKDFHRIKIVDKRPYYYDVRLQKMIR